MYNDGECMHDVACRLNVRNGAGDRVREYNVRASRYVRWYRA